jgi:hypothetical protein
MYELQYLCELINERKHALNTLIDKYDDLMDACMERDLTDEEDAFIDYLDSFNDLFEEASDAIDEILDMYF